MNDSLMFEVQSSDVAIEMTFITTEILGNYKSHYMKYFWSFKNRIHAFRVK